MLYKNKQGEVTMTGRNSHAASVTSWHAKGAGDCTAALPRYRRMMRSDGAKGRYRTAARTVTSKVETNGTARAVVAGSTLGRWPNEALQQTRPLLRMLLNLNGSGWGLAAETSR